MSATDKIKNAAEDVQGKVKEVIGKGKDDEQLEAEGRKDQTKADMKKTGESAKDVFKN